MRLTESAELVHADEGAAESQESVVDVDGSLVADCEASGAVQLHHRSRGDPAVAGGLLAPVYARGGQRGGDGTRAAPGPAAAVVVGLVGVEPPGPPPPEPLPTADLRHGADLAHRTARRPTHAARPR